MTWTARLSWCYLVATLATWALLVVASERFLPATLLAYGPRWIVGLPLLLLFPLALLAARAALLPLTLSLLVVLWPIMGGRLSLRTAGRGRPTSPERGAMRVITLNSFGKASVAGRLDALLALRPDLVTFQECTNGLHGALLRVPGMHVARYHGLCTLSRWPISRVDSLPRYGRTLAESAPNRGSALALRHTVTTPGGRLVLVNVHLETARRGLQSFMRNGGVLPDDLADLRRTTAAVARPDSTLSEGLAVNTEVRARESARAALWALAGSDSVPVIVTGDFNLPVESTIYDRYWGDFDNAFESTGTGFGFTKREGALRIRIDHVLVNHAAPAPIGTWIGPHLGSDHLPVIADLKWRTP